MKIAIDRQIDTKVPGLVIAAVDAEAMMAFTVNSDMDRLVQDVVGEPLTVDNLKKFEELGIIERLSDKLRDPKALYRFKSG